MLTSPNRKHNRQFFYKYTTAEDAKSILINKTLRFSSPLSFNDPFDVARKLKFAFSSEEFNSGLRNELIRLIQNEPTVTVRNSKLQALLDYSRTLNSEQKERIVNLIKNYSPTPEIDEIGSFKELQRQWESLLPLSRILSVSAENDNPMMWWCYANKYKGVVIELECIDIYDSLLLVARQVDYTDKLPTIGSLEYWIRMTTGQTKFDYKEVFERLELTKTHHWAHEKEWRVISFEKNSDQLYTDYPVHPRTFSKIYFGENMDDIDKQEIEKLIDFDLSHMEMYEMILNHDCRQIQFEKVRKAT